LKSPFFLMHAKLRSALSPLGGIDATLMQCKCVTRSLHSNCLGWRSNPYSPCFRPSAL